MSEIPPTAGIDRSASPHPVGFDLTGPEGEGLIEYEVLSGEESASTPDLLAGGNHTGEQT